MITTSEEKKNDNPQTTAVRALAIMERGIRTWKDLAEFHSAAMFDLLSGAVTVKKMNQMLKQVTGQFIKRLEEEPEDKEEDTSTTTVRSRTDVTARDTLKDLIWREVQEYWNEDMEPIGVQAIYLNVGRMLWDWPFSYESFEEALDCLEVEGLIHYDSETCDISEPRFHLTAEIGAGPAN